MANAEAHLRKDKKLTKVVDSLGPHDKNDGVKTRRQMVFESFKSLSLHTDGRKWICGCALWCIF